MDSKKLEILKTAVDSGSFTKASEICGYTQSGLTHMMDSLEREIGFSLLVRGHSGIKLTDRGEMLMPAIRDFLRADALLKNRIAEIAGQQEKTIRIAAYASIAMRWMPEILYRFKRKCPGTDVDLRMVDHALEPFELLEDGKTDVIFASRQDYSSCSWLPLYREPLYAILPRDYPLNGRSSFPLREFEGQAFLIPYGRFDLDIKKAFSFAGAKITGKEARVDDETVIRMVGKGLGVSMMGELMIRGATDDVLCVPLEPACFREIGMGTRKDSRQPGDIDTLKDCVMLFLREKYGQQA